MLRCRKRLRGADVYEISADRKGMEATPNPFWKDLALQGDWLRLWNGAQQLVAEQINPGIDPAATWQSTLLHKTCDRPLRIKLNAPARYGFLNFTHDQ